MKNAYFSPMDLTTLRKNVESGVVTSTEQFHREMLLIFVNAIMYNSSKHEVYQMAKEISSEFLRHMQVSQFTIFLDYSAPIHLRYYQEFLALKTPATTDSSSKSLRHRTAKIELLDVCINVLTQRRY